MRRPRLFLPRIRAGLAPRLSGPLAAAVLLFSSTGCQDLYYRLKGVVVDLPALRERREDVPLLAERFREVFAKEHDRPVTGFTPAALSALMSYAWPGNVREMKSAIEWAVFIAAGPRIDVTDLPPVAVGDPVTLWGDGVPVEQVAQAAGTIAYELICGVSQRVHLDVR